MAGLSRWRGYPSPVTDYDAELPPGYRLVPARTTYLEMPCNKIPLQQRCFQAGCLLNGTRGLGHLLLRIQTGLIRDLFVALEARANNARSRASLCVAGLDGIIDPALHQVGLHGLEELGNRRTASGFPQGEHALKDQRKIQQRQGNEHGHHNAARVHRSQQVIRDGADFAIPEIIGIPEHKPVDDNGNGSGKNDRR